AAPGAAVDQAVADADDEPAENALIHLSVEDDVAAGECPELLLDGSLVVGRKGDGARDGGGGDAFCAIDEFLERFRDLGAERGAPAAHDEAGGVQDERGG